ILGDGQFDNTPVEVPLSLILGKPPRMLRDVQHRTFRKPEFDPTGIAVDEAAFRVLRLPAVASKGFLITIGDRTVTGLVCRDQMVGPWQVPVADAAVTSTDHYAFTGEAVAMGERTPLALVDGPASGRMAVGEAITNLAGAAIGELSQLRLSANWMAPAGHPGEDAILFDTAEAVGRELCPRLGIAIPVGKDSLSMKTVWEQDGEPRSVTAPLSLIVTAFAPVEDVRLSLTPQLRTDQGETELILIDLGKGHNRLAGSALAQVYKQVGHYAPDLDDPDALKAFFVTIQELNRQGRLLAYHDRSDGGLFVTLCEMAFAGHTGLDIDLDGLGGEPLEALFNEELGAVIQVRREDAAAVHELLHERGLGRHSHVIGRLNAEDRIFVRRDGTELLNESRLELQRAWAETSYRIQALRDNPETARQEFDSLLDLGDPGLHAELTFDPAEDVAAPYINQGARPAMAVLREQGVNGQIEMAAAFQRAGFDCVDVHMSDVIDGRIALTDFRALVACGGFSYGDVLGAGLGWAKSILFNPRARDEFTAFFARDDSFALGVCNGCQMLAGLKELIPGSEHWPRFVRNTSEQFEARLSLVEVVDSPSILLRGMAGSRMPVAVAHGEGRAGFERAGDRERLLEQGGMALRYVDHYGRATEAYPFNPNGSPQGITGVTSRDGRVTLMMPHPERVFRTVQHSWHPDDWGEHAPWLRLFRNARVWVD
ncbi:MAG TPA: phosphoribosylformylglycinamidine synthase, partial [Thiohalobacter sp.]|nr:phosphoribosylformylglycinamidine synthase [Thiohalobacter sp.]